MGDVERVAVVSHDQFMPRQIGFEVGAVQGEVEEALKAIYGLPLLIFPVNSDGPAMLVTDADYSLLAATPAVLKSYAGDLRALRDEFVADSWDPNPGLAGLLSNAVHMMDWISEDDPSAD
jgi:hypothetical protein